MSRQEYTYVLRKVIPLSHLSDTLLTIWEMKGGNIVGKQFYINTTYRVPENMRYGEKDAGIRRTKGISVAEKDLPGVIEGYKAIANGNFDPPRFICDQCTIDDDVLVLHQKKSADDPDVCPKYNKQNNPAPAKTNSFVVK